MVSDDAIPGLDDLDPGCGCADLRQVASLSGDDEFAAALIERARKANEAGYRLATVSAERTILTFGEIEIGGSQHLFMGSSLEFEKDSKQEIEDAINWLTFNGLATYDAETQVVTLNG